jgi:hypothetical protein
VLGRGAIDRERGGTVAAGRAVVLDVDGRGRVCVRPVAVIVRVTVRDGDDHAGRVVRMIVVVERDVEVRQDLDTEQPQHARHRGKAAAAPSPVR